MNKKSKRGGGTLRPVIAEPLESRTLFTALPFAVPLPNGAALPATYGDHVAASPQNGYSYGSSHGFTPHIGVSYGSVAGNARVWGKGFGDLSNAIYGKDGIIQVTFTADANHLAELESFDLGGYFHADHVINSVTVTSGSTVLFSNRAVILVKGTTHTAFNFPTPLFAKTMTLTINATALGGQKTFVGLGNLVFSEAPNCMRIQGEVVNDTNANGTKETGEQGLAGVTLYLDANNNDKPDAGEKSVVSDAFGNYNFGQVPVGSYHVREVMPAGFRMSKSTADGFTVSGEPGIYYVHDLYDTPKAVINGTMFLDLNNNGVRDANEFGAPIQEGIAGTEFQLFKSHIRGVVATAYTDAVGNFTFDDLSPGTYIATYVVTNFFTTASTFTVTVGPGGSASVLFGEAYTG